METNLNTKIYNADLYLRLSKEDGDKEESDSITNQKELILEYLKSMEDIKIHEIRVAVISFAHKRAVAQGCSCSFLIDWKSWLAA